MGKLHDVGIFVVHCLFSLILCSDRWVTVEHRPTVKFVMCGFRIVGNAQVACLTWVGLLWWVVDVNGHILGTSILGASSMLVGLPLPLTRCCLVVKVGWLLELPTKLIGVANSL